MGIIHTRQLIKCLHHPENEKNARASFELLDKDKSGGLDHKEFEEFARTVLKADLEDKMEEDEYMIPFAFDLDYGEVVKKLRAHHIEDFAQRMFDQADKDKDDVISFDEFVAFLKVHSENPYEVSGLNKYRQNRVVKEALHEPESVVDLPAAHLHRGDQNVENEDHVIVGGEEAKEGEKHHHRRHQHHHHKDGKKDSKEEEAHAEVKEGNKKEEKEEEKEERKEKKEKEVGKKKEDEE